MITINFKRGSVLLTLFILALSPSLWGKSTRSSPSLPVKMAIFDTGFCPGQIPSLHPFIKIHPVFDATSSVHYDCQKIDLKNRRYHGHLVLKRILNQLQPNSRLEIFPVILFNQQGKQRLSYWQKGIAYALQKNVHLIASATGYPLKPQEKEAPTRWPSLGQSFYFLSSGRKGVGLPQNTQLYPQEKHDQKKVILVGPLYPPLNSQNSSKGWLFDPALLYQKKIDYFATTGQAGDLLRGSSRALAEFTRFSLKNCLKIFVKKSAEDELRRCLAPVLLSVKPRDFNRQIKVVPPLP